MHMNFSFYSARSFIIILFSVRYIRVASTVRATNPTIVFATKDGEDIFATKVFQILLTLKFCDNPKILEHGY